MFTAGRGLIPPQPTIVVRDEDGVERVIAPGNDPEWLHEREIVFVDPSGSHLVAASAPDWQPRPSSVAGANALTAARGFIARGRLDPRRVLLDDREIHGASDPCFSPDARYLAYLIAGDQDRNTQLVVWDRWFMTTRTVYTGAPLDARFGWGSTSLTWNDSGRVYGIAGVGDPASPVVELTVPDYACSFARSVWAPAPVGKLYVAMVLDTGAAGRVIVAEWDALAAGARTGKAGMGYIVGESSKGGFDLAAAVAA